MLARALAALRKRTRQWARKRHGIDSDPLILSGRRIYIVPSSLGIAFSLMLFAMFLGAMNYANNLALGLTFMLGALALTAMHYCHRNLAGIQIRSAASEPVFAGQTARFRLALENDAKVARHELTIANEYGIATPVRVEPGARVVLELETPAPQRGLLRLDAFEITTRHPFGMFRAWAYLNMEIACVVYPKPSPRGLPPPPLDSPRRIAWKAYAREQGLQVKLYAGTAVTSHSFDWEALGGLGTEARLSQLCRWVEDAHAAGRAFGLRLPGVEIAPNVGPGHRQRCLTALALFDEQASHG
jgi:uncharacterized protein (DUF58 family)